MTKDYKEYVNSRISDKFSKVFLKTNMPLAGGFLRNEDIENEKIYPLTLSFCEESSSVQVNESINPKILFNNYFYKTGSIQTLKNHLKLTSDKIKLNYKHDKIIDLGCNDFTFLKNFLNKSDLIVGVDPSNVSKNNLIDGIELDNDFFNYSKSEEIKNKYGDFDIIFSSNNFAHIENIQNYAKGISNLLSENGTFVCEVHWVGSLIKNMQFSFIYHEHLYYYTLKSLKYLLEKYNLYINDVDEIDIHGGSIRIFASKNNIKNQSVDKFLLKEEQIGLYNFETYKNFAEKINILKKKNKLFFKECKENNKTVVGYGASGQANTIMSFFDITKDDLSGIIDDSPLKHGLLTPQNHIEIKNKDFLLKKNPDYIYVLAYTFFDEIKNKNKELKSTWIKPILEC
jgi:SAM-dependent methyltransferase